MAGNALEEQVGTAVVDLLRQYGLSALGIVAVAWCISKMWEPFFEFLKVDRENKRKHNRAVSQLEEKRRRRKENKNARDDGEGKRRTSG